MSDPSNEETEAEVQADVDEAAPVTPEDPEILDRIQDVLDEQPGEDQEESD